MTGAGQTIAAIATPGGRGGIGIVRVSGPDAPAIGRQLTGRVPRPRLAEYCCFRDGDGAAVDRGIMLYFPRPASYTGEDVLELHGHGGQVVMHMLLRRVLALGARPARPGEFTERAFVNGKIDLLQAEAVADLIDSLSERAARSALRSLDGAFSARIAGLRDTLVRIRALAEAVLDFPEEDVRALPGPPVEQQLEAWLAELDRVAAAARAGSVLREGLRVVVAGPPNVGKSSLLNLLTDSDRAIVHSEPGTTRDTLEEGIVVGGIRMQIVDTAGIRAAADPVEEEGVRRALRAMQGADIVIAVSEYGTPEDESVADALRSLPRGINRVFVRNKIDLAGAAPGRKEDEAGLLIDLSARTGAGVGLLVDALREAAGPGASGEDIVLARARHIAELAAARAAVGAGLEGWRANQAGELLAEELRLAQASLGRITGEFTPDDLLGEIFSRFCIGK
ncbi:MAG: tRNA uridine-5-carboxymethylaminomethyl(34) synthesis GTPase MnmE [Gammaproteobacteria bacterium]|nr:tRNA uridine-5-carboxymethylaminomethyl(34) synthesis GTPase MnmE [Gammaproteobacteria bacterium]